MAHLASSALDSLALQLEADVVLSNMTRETAGVCAKRSRKCTQGTVVANDSCVRLQPPVQRVVIHERVGRASWTKDALCQALCQLFVRTFHPKDVYTEALKPPLTLLTDYVNGNQSALRDLIGDSPLKYLLDWAACNRSQLLRQLKITEMLGISDIGGHADLLKVVSDWSNSISEFQIEYTRLRANGNPAVVNSTQMKRVGHLLQTAATAVRKAKMGLDDDAGMLARRPKDQAFAKAVADKMFKLIRPSKSGIFGRTRYAKRTTTEVLHQIMKDKHLWKNQLPEQRRWEQVLRPAGVDELKGLTELLISCFRNCRMGEQLRTGFLDPQNGDDETTYAEIPELQQTVPSAYSTYGGAAPRGTTPLSTTRPVTRRRPFSPGCSPSEIYSPSAPPWHMNSTIPAPQAGWCVSGLPRTYGEAVARSTAGAGNFLGSQQQNLGGNLLQGTTQRATRGNAPPMWGPSGTFQSQMVDSEHRSAFAAVTPRAGGVSQQRPTLPGCRCGGGVLQPPIIYQSVPPAGA